MAEEKEKLIAKLQLEYATKPTPGTESIQVIPENLDWDFGLLYLTNKSLWFVNRKQERMQIPFETIGSFSDLKKAEGERTKFSTILNATHILIITYRQSDKSSAIALLAAAADVLGALKSQLSVRTPKPPKATQIDRDLELNKKISVLLFLGIKDDEMLKYLLNVSRRELVSLVIARSRYLK